MGFSDRDYLREDPYDDHGYRRRSSNGPMSMSMRIIILNFVIWIANGLLFPENHLLSRILAFEVSSLSDPLRWYELLTYGFAHSPTDIYHIGGNMLGLVMFGYGMMLGIGPNGFGLVRGSNVEERLGRTEYLAFYLTTIVVGALVFGVVNWDNPRAGAWGASGGITGIIILFALFYPHKILLLFGIIPMPMWALGLMIVAMDAYGHGYGLPGVAYSIHLAGAGFALFYYYFFYLRRYRLVDLFLAPTKFLKRKPKLKIYTEQKPRETQRKSEQDLEFEKKLDHILDRYGKVGESGLTSEEREFLQRASKRYRDKKS